MRRNFKVAKSVNTLLLGDSHIQYAVNDTLFHNSINLSQISEGYIYTFFKLKEIVQSNPNITSVILGYGYHDFSTISDESIFANHYSYCNFFFILPNKERVEVFKKNKIFLGEQLPNIFKSGYDNLTATDKNYSFLRAYKPVFTNLKINKSSISRRIAMQFYEGNKTRGFSALQENYLDSIINFCDRKKIKLILLNTPLHKEYLAQVPEIFKIKYYSFIQNKRVFLIDLKDLQLKDDCFLPDGDHLSYKGALETTKYLYSTVNSPVKYQRG
ncbi:MAG: hypothetical protein M3040_18705 [Bacteroidota bacterium]|nr:hypothetical protein [Bacteroidota bacterium]